MRALPIAIIAAPLLALLADATVIGGAVAIGAVIWFVAALAATP